MHEYSFLVCPRLRQQNLRARSIFNGGTTCFVRSFFKDFWFLKRSTVKIVHRIDSYGGMSSNVFAVQRKRVTAQWLVFSKDHVAHLSNTWQSSQELDDAQCGREQHLLRLKEVKLVNKRIGAALKHPNLKQTGGAGISHMVEFVQSTREGSTHGWYSQFSTRM